MNYETWEPVYERILSDFGYSRAADERARDVLARLVDPVDESRFAPLTDATVAVAGAGPSLDDGGSASSWNRRRPARPVRELGRPPGRRTAGPLLCPTQSAPTCARAPGPALRRPAGATRLKLCFARR